VTVRGVVRIRVLGQLRVDDVPVDEEVLRRAAERASTLNENGQPRQVSGGSL